ncbi:hypothetical protein EBS02_10330, partial [bacterium]|nr:hypothetical protein [bacterium]
MVHKTLLGKNGYLFLINDTCQELEVHCNNVNFVKDPSLSHLKLDHYMMTLFPNKSLLYAHYLPDGYEAKYRPAYDIYKKKLGDRLLDGYEILKPLEEETYYKTDTHINLQGNYAMYLAFIEHANRIFDLNLVAKIIRIQRRDNVELSTVGCGIGDLTWPSNLEDQILESKEDTYYFTSDFEPFYCHYTIQNNPTAVRFLTYHYLEDVTSQLENSVVQWDILSKHILYKRNDECHHRFKVLIFYDSFLL